IENRAAGKDISKGFSFSSPGNLTDAELEKISGKVWGKFNEAYNGKWDDEHFGVYGLLDGVMVTMKDGDKKDDYLFWPEMTVNAMLISCGVRKIHQLFRGPDVAKTYEEIGNRDNKKEKVGIEYAKGMEKRFILRHYGSEIWLEYNQDVDSIDDIDPKKNLHFKAYTDPIRRKIYDPTLPVMDFDPTTPELAPLVIISWEDTKASVADFNNF
ncbi:hypothetical protein HYY75_01085, partial [bacterium]|nr:hypothetical protein [bacterium]